MILHEYGHAIHFSQNFDFGGEGGAISEGFGDYWAVTVSDHISPTPDEPCVADWDSVSYTSTVPHCLRRVDTNLHYPDDLNGEVHHDGQIWSRALWDIRNALGADDRRHDHPAGLVRLPRHDDDRPRESHGARGAGPLRLGRGDEGQEGVPGPRDPLTISSSGSTSSRSSGRSSAACRSRGARAGRCRSPRRS